MDEISNLIASLAERLNIEAQLAGGLVTQEPRSVHAGEWQLVAGASHKRQREFTCGRYYAHHLLNAAGYGDYCIGRDDRGCPVWPDGMVGSISHTNDYCVATIARSHPVQGIGIDLEECGRMKESLWSRLFTEQELHDIKAAASQAERMRMAAIIFSAKEAFYKCDYPIRGRSYDFADVTIAVDDARHLLRFDFHCADQPVSCEGCYVSGVTHVMTVVYQ